MRHEHEVAEFEAEFAKLAALIEQEATDAQEAFRERLRERVQAKEHEAHERAEWAARDVDTID